MNKREMEKYLRDCERAKFFSDCQRRMEKSCQDYLLTQGYYITNLKSRKNLDLEDKIFGSLLPDIQEYIKQVKFVADGVRITTSRKEKMLSCIYAVENKVAIEGKNPNNIKELVDELNKNFWVQFCLILGIITLPILPISIILFMTFYAQYKKRKEIKEKIKKKSVKLLSKLPLI